MIQGDDRKGSCITVRNERTSKNKKLYPNVFKVIKSGAKSLPLLAKLIFSEVFYRYLLIDLLIY